MENVPIFVFLSKSKVMTVKWGWAGAAAGRLPLLRRQEDRVQLRVSLRHGPLVYDVLLLCARSRHHARELHADEQWHGARRRRGAAAVPTVLC